MQALVSVVVPVYNVGEHVRRCIESVIFQTFRDWQLILVDDGSTDVGASIVDEYVDRRIKTIHKHNEGVTAARRDGLALAEADYVLFLDADDYLGANALEVLYRKAVETNADAVVGDFVIDWGDRHEARVFERFCKTDNVGYVKYCLRNRDFYYTGRLYRRRLLDEIHRQIPTDITYGEDNVAVMLLASSVKCAAQVARPVLYYVQRPESVTNRLSLYDLQKRNKALAIFARQCRSLSFACDVEAALNAFLAREVCSLVRLGLEPADMDTRVDIPTLKVLGPINSVLFLGFKICPAMTVSVITNIKRLKYK